MKKILFLLFFIFNQNLLATYHEQVTYWWPSVIEFNSLLSSNGFVTAMQKASLEARSEKKPFNWGNINFDWSGFQQALTHIEKMADRLMADDYPDLIDLYNFQVGVLPLIEPFIQAKNKKNRNTFNTCKKIANRINNKIERMTSMCVLRNLEKEVQALKQEAKAEIDAIDTLLSRLPDGEPEEALTQPSMKSCPPALPPALRASSKTGTYLPHPSILQRQITEMGTHPQSPGASSVGSMDEEESFWMGEAIRLSLTKSASRS